MSVPNVFDIRPPNHARGSNCNELDAIRRARVSPEPRVHTGEAARYVLYCTYSPISLSYYYWRVVFAAVNRTLVTWLVLSSPVYVHLEEANDHEAEPGTVPRDPGCWARNVIAVRDGSVGACCSRYATPARG